MTNRAQFTTPVTLIVLVVVASVGVVIVNSASPSMDDSVSEEYDRAQAYCYQSYGDPDISNAQVIGSHGGWHCEANDGDPHLHAVTDEAKQAAYYANQTNQSIDWSAVDRYKPGYERGLLHAIGPIIDVLAIVTLLALLIYIPRVVPYPRVRR